MSFQMQGRIPIRNLLYPQQGFADYAPKALF